MSARRAARAKPALVTARAGSRALPAALAIGRCVEVWADPALDGEPPRSVARLGSAKRRFGIARAAWLDDQGVSETDGFKVIPAGATWAASGDRLARHGYGLDDLPRLAAEADQLFAAALGGGALTRAYRRTTRKAIR